LGQFLRLILNNADGTYIKEINFAKRLYYGNNNNLSTTEYSISLKENYFEIATEFDELPNKRYVDFNGNLIATPTKLNLKVGNINPNNVNVLKNNSDGSYFAVLNGFQFVKLIKTKGEKQVITFDKIANKLATDKEVQLKATSSSLLPIQFTVVSGPASINSENILTLDGASGIVEVKASQNGNEIYDYTETNQLFEVSKLSQTIPNISIADKDINSPKFGLNVKASSGLPLKVEILSGPARSINDTLILTREVGEVKLRVTQNGNYQFLPANEIRLAFNVIILLANEPSIIENFLLYPNPNNGDFNLSLPQTSNDYKFEIFDTSGRLIMNQSNINNGKVQLDFGVGKGNYILKLINKNNQVKSIKFFVE
jgi:Secretion system C-terminal sorting domain